MESEELDLLVSESLMLLSGMIHSFGHRVVELRSCIHLLQRNPMLRSVKETREVKRISEIADELAADLRLMRLLGSDIDLISCNFVEDILKPVVSFAYSRHHKLRLIVDPSVREVSLVQIRPSLMRQALLRLILATTPTEVRCTGTTERDQVIISLVLHPVAPLTEELQGKLTHLINMAEGHIEEPFLDRNACSVKLRLRTQGEA
jgi:hypothetical protein